MHKERHIPPIFCAAIPVLAQMARHSGFLAYFFRSASMMDLRSNDLPVPYFPVKSVSFEGPSHSPEAQDESEKGRGGGRTCGSGKEDTSTLLHDHAQNIFLFFAKSRPYFELGLGNCVDCTFCCTRRKSLACFSSGSSGAGG